MACTLKMIVAVAIIIVIVHSITKNKFLTAGVLMKVALDGIKLSVTGQILIGHANGIRGLVIVSSRGSGVKIVDQVLNYRF